MNWPSRFWRIVSRRQMHLGQSNMENGVRPGDTDSHYRIFELQERTIGSLITITLLWPLLIVLTPFYFYRSPLHLIFQYLCPIIPFVVCFDGYVSSLRTRTPEEVMDLLQIAAALLAENLEDTSSGGKALTSDGHEDKAGGELILKRWKFMNGSEMHTPPIGTMSWITCVKDEVA